MRGLCLVAKIMKFRFSLGLGALEWFIRSKFMLLFVVILHWNLFLLEGTTLSLLMLNTMPYRRNHSVDSGAHVFGWQGESYCPCWYSVFWLIEGTVLSFLLLLSLAGTILSLLSHSACVHNNIYLPTEILFSITVFWTVTYYIKLFWERWLCFESETSLFFWLGLERLVEPLRNTCTMKVKANSVKQEYEKQDELKRSAMRAVAALLTIPDAGV